MKQIFYLLLICPLLLTAQIDVAFTAANGYYSDKDIELGLEGRLNIKVAKDWFISPSAAFVSDGINFQTFPKLGVTRKIYNRKHNWNRVTLGIQAYDFDLPRSEIEGWNTTTLMSTETWKLRPFIRFDTPILKLFKNRNNGAQRNALLLIFTTEVTERTWNTGLGIRKRI